MIETEYMTALRAALLSPVTPDRTGVGQLKLPFSTFTIPAEYKGKIILPIQTARPMSIKNCWKEMQFFLSGETDTLKLEAEGIFWWTEHTSRDFLDSRGMYNWPEGSLGKSYSHQFRKTGDDQLFKLIESIIKTPESRRMAIDLWGVKDQHEMPLLPCWYRSGWSIDNGELNLALYNRSCDMLFGFWQAVCQYRLLQVAIAKYTGYKVGEMNIVVEQPHIYANQIEYVKELVNRDLSYKQATVELNVDIQPTANDVITELLDLDWREFTINNYEPNHEQMQTPRPPIAV